MAPETVTPEQRNIGKTINFATIYGQGAHALAQMIGVPMREAKRYIDAYFAHYEGVRNWLDRTTEQALADGWVATDPGDLDPGGSLFAGMAGPDGSGPTDAVALLMGQLIATLERPRSPLASPG